MATPNNPTVTVNLKKTRIKANPQGYHARAVVVGFGSLARLGQIYTLRSDGDLAQLGNGEGVEQAAEIGNQAGYPVYFVGVVGTPQAPSSPTKHSASGATPKTVYGQILVAGADTDGDLLFQALVGGATLTVAVGGMYGALAAVVTGNAVILQVPSSTAASAVVTFWNGSDANAVLARAIFSIAAQGTAASNVAALTTTAADNGNLTFTAPAAGYQVRIVAAGNNTALSASYGGTGNKQLTINLATDADGTPTSTASAIAALSAITSGPIVVTVGGTGMGRAGILSSFFTLLYGSSGALAVTGNGVDAFFIRVTVTRGGTVGSAGLGFVWSADLGVTESSEVLIPSTGVVVLADSRLTTGLTVTFSGTLEVGDYWDFFAPKPVVAFTDLEDSIDIIVAATSYKLGFITSPTVFSRSHAQIIDQKLQAARNTMWLRALFNVRDPNNGEVRTDWEAAVGNDFIGFFSSNGLIRMCAGSFSHLSTYTGREYVRPWVFQVAARRCSIAVHQDCMQKDLGGLPNIRYAVNPDGTIDDPGIFYDCFPNGALQSQRFVCPRTFPGEPGQFYINTSPTMSDPSDRGYTRIEYSDFVLESSRICQTALNDTIGKTYRDIPQPESELVPAGALDIADAQIIDDYVNDPVVAYMYGIKTDGNVSASPMPVGQRPYATRRDYSYATEEPPTVRGTLTVPLRAVNEQVVVDVTPTLGG